MAERHPRRQLSSAARASRPPNALESGGFDAGKRTKCRQRHIVTDTLGLTVGLVVHGADVQDRPVLVSLRDHAPELRHMYADGA
ncbi:transposase [Aureimonas ureilytica]|uniref:transposase n=1 Tax=Aureimonas ureilytica TaxID=401562 RepID=UPI0019D4C5F7